MASQARAGPGEQLSCYEIQSFVRGVHAYKEYWDPKLGQVLTLKRKRSNSHDKHVVAVVKLNSTIVGHLPYNIVLLILFFLARDYNKGRLEWR